MTNPSPGVLRGLLLGAAAGAAGTTALNAVTYVDMAWRGRGASSAPEDTVEALAKKAGQEISGEGDERSNRVTALGALSGIATGIGIGAVAGAAHGAGLPDIATVVSGPLVGALAMATTDGSMAVLDVSDPTTWSATDWLSDAVPHLVYGLVTVITLHALRGRETS